jgi:D-3-phosphoglycerate dehydrogenase
MTAPLILATQVLDDYACAVLEPFAPVRVASSMQEATLRQEIQHAIGLVVRGQAPITAAVIDAAPHLKVIGRTGVGYDTIDIAAATRRGIPVVYTPGVGARAVAEATLGFMLALCKMITHWDRELKAGNWHARYQTQGRDLDGQTLGIIGLGRIGKLVADMARPFHMRVVAFDPYVDSATGLTHGVEMLPMNDVLQQADFLTLHCPQNSETLGFINRPRLEMLKPGAYLINLARGGVIDSLDTVDALLRNGHLGGAALDVFNDEPCDTRHPLFQNRNLLVSPHAMATTRGAMTRIFKAMSDDMAAVFQGRTPDHVVNPETLTGSPS